MLLSELQLGNIQRKKQTKREQEWSLTSHLKMPWARANINKHKSKDSDYASILRDNLLLVYNPM